MTDGTGNTIAIGENKIMNREGLRYPQEFVRHKILDAVGDLALAGKPLLAAYRSVRGGHRLNSLVVKALLASNGFTADEQVAAIEFIARNAGDAVAGTPDEPGEYDYSSAKGRATASSRARWGR